MTIRATIAQVPVLVRRLGAVLLCVAAAAATESAFAGGSPFLTPVTMLPSSIGFFNSTHGLIGTGAPPCREMISIPQCRAGAILATSDGGRTTRVVLRTPGPVTSVAIAPGGQAWAFSFRCSSAPLCTQGTLFHSGNEGRTWQKISHLPLEALSFGDGSHGLAVLLPNACDPTCDPLASLAASADGGRTWQRVDTPCGHDGPLGLQVQGVSLVTRTRGWLLCMGDFSQTGRPPLFNETAHKSIYRTDNAGETWKLILAVAASTANGLPRRGAPQGIAFAPSGFGVMWESFGSQYLTRDGGLHWQPLEPVEKENGLAGSATNRRLALLLAPVGQPVGLLTTIRLAETSPNRATLTTVRSWRYR